jgi:hypothetical protein
MAVASSRVALVLAILSLACAPALAQEKGNEYEVTVKMEMKGMPMAMPPRTTKVCVAKNGKDESYVPMRSGSDCRITDSKKTGNTLSYRMECTGKDAITGEGEVTYATDSYSGKMHMVGKGENAFDMTQTYNGRKIGECANPVR